jgi:hypothetical protein
LPYLGESRKGECSQGQENVANRDVEERAHGNQV